MRKVVAEIRGLTGKQVHTALLEYMANERLRWDSARWDMIEVEDEPIGQRHDGPQIPFEPGVLVEKAPVYVDPAFDPMHRPYEIVNGVKVETIGPPLPPYTPPSIPNLPGDDWPS